jgi:hypothetical protein
MDSIRISPDVRSLYASVALGIVAAAAVLLMTPVASATILSLLLLGSGCWWLLLRSHRWLIAFLCALIILPPLPIRLGDSGPHPALIVLCIGLLSIAIHLRPWNDMGGRLGLLLCGFTFCLLFSVLMAATNSGVEVALGSLSRVVLFAVAPLVFFFCLNSPYLDGSRVFMLTKWIFRAGVLAALFACVDFYFQLSAPAGFGPQFVWLDQGVFRRAQGLFYEASTLGNFCAFFLVFVLVALRRPSWQIQVSRLELMTGAIVFASALMLSYSRGSLVNVIAAAIALSVLNRKAFTRSGVFFVVCAVLSPVLIYIFFPAFAESYLSRLFQSVAFIWSTPNGVLSGRLDSWMQITNFLLDEPWRVLLGIGYKTLPYSDLVGSTVIADNTYLSLLVELGAGGLLLFFALNAEILRRSFRAFRSGSDRQSLFGEWMFCFWVGELVQMVSGDLITYWRVLPLYFWVLAMAVRKAGDGRLAEIT